MSKHLLKLNKDKTEVIIFGKKDQSLKTAKLLGMKGFEVIETSGSLLKSHTKAGFYHFDKTFQRLKTSYHR